MTGESNILLVDQPPRLGRSVRRRLGQSARLLTARGLTAGITYEPPTARLLAELAGAYAARNADAGRVVDWAWWATSCQLATEAGTLRIGGLLAAWTLGWRVPPDYRVLAGQMVPGYAEYFPGRWLEADLIGRLAADPDIAVLDWGPGHPETLLAVTRSGTGPAR